MNRSTFCFSYSRASQPRIKVSCRTIECVMSAVYMQAAATHDGPYVNLLDHMFDPLGINILTNLPYINE